MQYPTDSSQGKPPRRWWRILLAVVVVIALAGSWQLGLLQDGLAELRRYRAESTQAPMIEESDAVGAVFDLGNISAIGSSSELAESNVESSIPEDDDFSMLEDFDPRTTPTVSRIDLDRLIHAAENLDSRRSCPRSQPPETADELIEILRFVDGCLLIEYEESGGRSVEQVREQYRDDPSILGVDRPALVVPLQSGADPEATNQWHLDAVDASTLQAGWPADGEVTVAVLDSGVDGTHNDLDANIVDLQRDVSNLPAGYYGPYNGRLDVVGHGTHVAGIIAAEAGNGIHGRGVAGSASILPVTVIGNQANCTPVQGVLSPAEGIAAVIGKDVDIINMSLFLFDIDADCQTFNKINADDPNRLFEDQYAINPRYSSDPNQTVEALVRLAQLRGIVVVASAGNCGGSGWWIFRDFKATCREENQRQYPAAFPGVVAVAATTQSGEHASYSTAADHVRIAAPGDSILATVPSNRMDIKSGTSMAAPVVSGIIAHLIARFPDVTPELIVSALYATAENPDGEVWTEELGYGLVRPLEAIRWLERNVGPRLKGETEHEREIDYDEIEETTGETAVILIMDTSGSMGETVDGQVKLEMAKASILEFISTTSPSRLVALRTYPAVGGNDCNSGVLQFPLSPRTHEMEATVVGLLAEGDTPTAEALSAALEDIREAGLSKAEIVLVSDGESTCAPPCDVASEIKAAGIEVTVRTAGFRLSREGDAELRCIAEATQGTHVEIDDGAELREFYERNAQPSLEVELDLPESVAPSTDPMVKPLKVEAVVRNDSNVAAKNVIVTLEVDDGAEPTRHPVAIGNVAAGQASTASWLLRPGFGSVGTDIGLEVSATAVNTEEVVSSPAAVTVETPNVADEAGPILGVGQLVMMGDQLLSGVGTSTRGAFAGCRRSREVGLLGVFGQRSERSIACANAVISHLASPDWARGIDSQINQLGELMDGPGAVNGVVMSVGATDFGLSELARECVVSRVACDLEVSGIPTDVWLGASIAGGGSRRAAAVAHLVRALAAIDQQLNGARGGSRQAPILLLAQPRALSLTSGACFERWQAGHAPLLTQPELNIYHHLVSVVNGTLDASAEAAQELGLPVFYVDTTETAYLPDHTACSAQPYVRSLEPLLEAGPDTVATFTQRGIPGSVGGDLDADVVAAFSEEFLAPNAHGEQALANAVLRWSRSEEAQAANETLNDIFVRRAEGVATGISRPATGDNLLVGASDKLVVEPDSGWTATAAGFLPGTLVTATLRPGGLVVGSAIADEDGTADLFVVLSPEAVSDGTKIVVTGRGPSGRTVSADQPVEVLPPLRPVHALVLPALAMMLLMGSFLLRRSARRAETRSHE